MRVRQARLEHDGPFVAKVAQETLGCFGDYGRLLPEWMQREEVLTSVLEQEGAPAGFYLLEAPAPTAEAPRFLDLLAIAVIKPLQGRGLGRSLLRHAVERAEALAAPRHLRELRLSVADHNRSARRLFEAEGFSLIPEELGTYTGGQLALRMSRPLGQDRG